jgi:hypothetical protein
MVNKSRGPVESVEIGVPWGLSRSFLLRLSQVWGAVERIIY